MYFWLIHLTSSLNAFVICRYLLTETGTFKNVPEYISCCYTKNVRHIPIEIPLDSVLFFYYNNKQGVFFWKSGHVVRALSDDWYVVRIHGRAAAAEDPTPEEHNLYETGYIIF